ncbi:MAG: glycoside hydrolase family 15 protein [Candidatus Thermoplasmatota archaeon]|jgi:glucoamylase|nr:glycoside hydrolase family 15 protein [Candidatus Thermoplasmatota archaeon]MCL5790628.1 glycoside hydrolase family 15 protein [Candidatus Thermoplasmatota archaeon]
MGMEPPGKPGIEPRWTSSAKDGVGSAISASSRVWYTVSHGIINEIFYPRIDIANTRDHEYLIVGDKFFSEEKRETDSETDCIEDGIPAFIIVNRHRGGKYELRKTVFSDPERDVLIEHVKFNDLSGENLKIYSLTAPHIKNSGYGNSGWIMDYKGSRFMIATRDGAFMALFSPSAQSAMSIGYSGYSDGWQLLSKEFQLDTSYDHANDGNIAMTAEINESSEFTFFIGFGDTPEEAALKTLLSYSEGWENKLRLFTERWKSFYSTLEGEIPNTSKYRLSRRSMSVIKSHQAGFQFKGGIIASLSIPWGYSKGDNDIGGYHLIWPRDMVEASEALLASGDFQDSMEALSYLRSTQEPDGHWPQNMWLDGKPYWKGIQMDEAAFPVILAYMLWRRDLVNLPDYIHMIRKAANYICLSGPATDQDRWEEDGGYSPFTIGVEISALICAAEMEDSMGGRRSKFYREVADSYNSNIERWTYVKGSEFAKQAGVEGHYIRIAPSDVQDYRERGIIPIKNRSGGKDLFSSSDIISTGSLALVRFGIRAWDDPRIINTVKVIDMLLKTETKNGPVWHRYNHDGYGEHDDGRPFDGTGRGRGWPLLVGERGMYEMAAGNMEEAEKLLHVMEKETGKNGMIPEQVWDSDDIPSRGLYNGKPSGSAMPLVWAHAEYLKLAKSIEQGEIFDRIETVSERYAKNGTQNSISIWSFKNRFRWIESGRTVRFISGSQFSVHYSWDKWHTVSDKSSAMADHGVFYADLKTPQNDSTELLFTFYWPESKKWEGVDFSITVK